MSDDEKDATKIIGAGRRKEWTQGIVNPPVWRASTILYDNIAHLRATGGKDTHHTLYYGRRGTPTQWSLAEALTELEPGAEATLLYPSGVAAVATALLAVLSHGDHLLVPDSAYEPTRNLARGLLKRMGIATTFYDPLIGAGIADLCTDATKAILMESPGSLTFEVQDVPAIVAVAKARGIATLIDNTWATPLLLPAIQMGVDYSILACTKYVGGHSDIMLGSVTAAQGQYARLRDATYQLGQCASPDDAFLGARGLRTMAIRLKQHDEAARTALIDGLRHFGIGYSWGGYESLAIPVDPHRTATKWSAEGPVVRLQIGLEDPDDLIADLDAGLARFRQAKG